MRGYRRIWSVMGVIAFCTLLGENSASASLVTGDLAFVGFNTDGRDGFAFVALTNVDANSTVYFRDDEWQGSSFNTGESVITWQSGITAIAAGSIIQI